jgi:cell fate (sporulation/competence/biofilm development) regulator YlbF (YheA/YmcA/DUF963 family)
MEENRDRILEKAKELGRLVSQTPEYAYLKAANRELVDDREATKMLNELRSLQEKVLGYIDKDEESPEELRTELDEIQSQVQASSRYQMLISTQTNFEKLMDRVNQEIGKGIREGDESRIIIPS